jgi:flagellar hook-associated protein 3 FlgL
MNINTSLGIHSALSVNTLIEMRNQLSDLQRQLGTGKKADSYAGLGLDRGLTIGLRSHLSTMSGFAQTISEVDIRLKLAGEALTQLDTINRSAKSTVMQSNFALTGGTQTTDQRTASVQFDQLLSVLNTSTGGRYIFSGRSVDQPPVADSDVILNGQGSRAGL